MDMNFHTETPARTGYAWVRDYNFNKLLHSCP